ncbi:TonB-denpendent receptor [Asticcacaulis sp. AC460]|uniref:TonB-dependent receptor n=1 Tax=Asticcacaulis sp. AC460 TaxID=1282360 RepID=UPI0003C3CDD6|nr:TonB-dependent receptor plug domain-containing protein [Asticcacaulis sp. AC460]ESQ90303.1 TonB-denpendent receptor [Asticcacaulis sp. AC460]
MYRHPLWLSLLMASVALPAMAQVPAAGEEIVAAGEPVYVFGKRRSEIGVAQSASEGVVSFARFDDRPLTRPGELVEVVPGMAATQHSGNTKANQYFLRGFNLDHGTDFSVSLDGVPLNLRSHGHGQGYLDLNGITPEVVETITYRKGPYHVVLGDFSNAGGAQFETFANGTPSYVQLTTGEDGYGRFLGVAGLGERSFLAVDYTSSRGPYDNPDNLRKLAITGRVGWGNWSLTGLAYDAHTNATDQVPQRAIDSGLISRLGAIDTSDGGETSRYILSLGYHGSDGLEATLYTQRYSLDLFSNFSYFLNDPVNGDQFQQSDQRWVHGGSVIKTWAQPMAGFTVRTGAEFRYDDIGRVGLYNTKQRQVLSTVREDRVREYSATVFADATRAFGPVRVTGGLRLDTIGGEVRSDDPRNSGEAHDVLLSPKFTAAWRVSEIVELYADAGGGFHSNDIRGATITVIPGSDDPAPTVDLFAASRGGELGARYSAGGFTATAALWALHLDSELVYIGDGGDTASTDATDRTGLELLFGYSPHSRLDINLTAAASHSRYAGDPPDGDRIPNALEYVVTGGITARLTPRLTTTLTVRTLGPAPLIEDNSRRSQATTFVNGLVDYDFGRFSLKLEALNLFDSRDNDIQYVYTSRLPGEPDEGVDDFHVHPFEPRTLRLSLRIPIG